MKRSHAIKLRDMMHKAAVSLDDEDALEAVELFPAWAVGKAYATDERIRYGEKLYRCVQAHTSQADWTPDEGDTPGNPIPYSGNMALISGKYYAQDGVTYRCTRDTVNPVYAALKDLVGLYVEVV